MPELIDLLKPIDVDVEHVFLDPNNLRLFGIPGEERPTVPEERIVEKSVQDDILQKMKTNFNIKPLRDSMHRTGFLPSEPVILMRIRQTNDFVTIEGNRRLAAIKWLLREHESGEITLPASRLSNLRRIRALLYKGSGPQAETDRMTLQGIRHISGVMDWGPYEKAKAVLTLKSAGKTTEEISQILYLKKRQIAQLLRAYYALEQMKQHAEFGEYAIPDMYTFFQEAVSHRYLRDNWLGWNESDMKFSNEQNLQTFYSWITASPDLGGGRKIPESIDVRDLESILKSESAMRVMNRPGTTIKQAFAEVVREEERIRFEERDFKRELRETVDLLQNLPARVLYDQENVRYLVTIEHLAKQRLREARRLGRSRTNR